MRISFGKWWVAVAIRHRGRVACAGFGLRGGRARAERAAARLAMAL